MTLTHMDLFTVKALEMDMVRDLDLVMANAPDLFPRLVLIVGRAAMTGNI